MSLLMNMLICINFQHYGLTSLMIYPHLKKFIGSSSNDLEPSAYQIDSDLGEEIVNNLKNNKTGKAEEVAKYFSEMRESFVEMKR